MAATTIRRIVIRKDTTNKKDSEGSKNIKIPPAVFIIAFALLFGFVRTRFNDRTEQQQQHQQQQKHRPTETLEDLLRKSGSSSSSSSPRSSLDQIRTGGGTQIISNFIHEEDLLNQLNSHELWKDCLGLYAKTNLDVLWMDFEAEPQSIWEELAVKIWQDHPMVQQQQQQTSDNKEVPPPPPIAGYEYWCNIVRPDTPLNWHVDKDEVVFEAAQYEISPQSLRTPIMGAVYYGYPHQFNSGGGFLERLPHSPHQIPDPTRYSDLDLQHHVERIHAEYNRLVVFNVSEWHRVTPIAQGLRYTFAVNIWTTKPALTATS